MLGAALTDVRVMCPHPATAAPAAATDPVEVNALPTAGGCIQFARGSCTRCARVVLPPTPLLPRLQWALITVRDFALPPGRVYAFTLTALDVSGLTAAATVTVEVNAPPTAGAVSVFPTWGYALVTGRLTPRKG